MKILDIHEFREGDRHGFGHFGASRGTRTHIGVDMVAYPGDYVYSPFSGTITKQGYAYNGANFRYIEITGKTNKCRIFYAELDDAHYVGKKVDENQFLGTVQDIASRYEGITPHVHFELYKASDINRLKPLDPTEFLKKKEIC
jgi:murein DD-endopeptidase MepM/ murein hydrolase activator NlpD